MGGSKVRKQDAEALGDAGGMLVDEVTGWVEQVHQAVADRVFRATGPIAMPVRVVHDGISRGVYGTVRGVGGAVARLAGKVGGRVVGDGDGTGLADSPRGATALGAVSGIIGDRLIEEDSALVSDLSWRLGGRAVEADELAASFEAPTGRIAVFVHGLCETELAWGWRAAKHAGPDGATGEVGHPARLQRDLGFTPAFVRFNSGRHVSDNGADLDLAVAELVDAWPVPIDEVVLIGHSMGGLIARSAVAQAQADHAAWLDHLTHVVCLGTPNLGAPLEKVVNAGAWALSLVPESAAFGRLLDTRSVGIKDLRHGFTAEQEWSDLDPADRFGGARAVATTRDGVRYHAIAATLGARDDGAAASVLGDLLVPPRSAHGRATRGQSVPFHQVHHLARLDHFDLLSHPQVTDLIAAAVSEDAS